MQELQWHQKMRNLLQDKDTTPEKEIICKKMISDGIAFLEKTKKKNPSSWICAELYRTDLEHAIIRAADPGSFDNTMLNISVTHSIFIVDQGWALYSKEMSKPPEAALSFEFFYDTSFDDYDKKVYELPDMFKKVYDDVDDFDGMIGEAMDEIDEDDEDER